MADHKRLLVSVGLPSPKNISFFREVWHCSCAAWANLRCDLRACDWGHLRRGSVGDAVSFFRRHALFTETFAQPAPCATTTTAGAKISVVVARILLAFFSHSSQWWSLACSKKSKNRTFTHSETPMSAANYFMELLTLT